MPVQVLLTLTVQEKIVSPGGASLGSGPNGSAYSNPMYNRLYDEYLRRFPDDPEGYLMRCYFLAGQKRTAEALAEYERLLTVNPNDSAALGLLQLLKQQAPTSALAELQKNEAIWKVYLEGIAKFREGEYEAAIMLWQQVLAEYPRNAETEKNIQQAKLRLKKNDMTN